MEIPVPPPGPPTHSELIDIATEDCFVELVNRAKLLGIRLNPTLGLVYLPDEKVIAEFRQACRAVIEALQVPSSPASWTL
jgi:hypothetical protein